jgi:AmmeMemoRadiSam system protein A
MSQPRPSHEQSSEKSPIAVASGEAGEFSQDERALLLRLAHDSILSALNHGAPDDGPPDTSSGADEGVRRSMSKPGEMKREISLDPPTAHLSEPRGVFTSLYLRGALRGCVGYVLPVNSVYHAVAETARAAAFEDTRFYPVTLPEAQALEIELSILSPPQAIAADAIEIGRHGLLITMNGHRGLLLPQVSLEHNWDRITFLQQTCRKAGLPLDAWKNGAKIEAFTAEVFGDKETQV